MPPTDVRNPATPPLIVSTSSCTGPLTADGDTSTTRPESIASWICAGVNGPLGCGAGGRVEAGVTAAAGPAGPAAVHPAGAPGETPRGSVGARRLFRPRHPRASLPPS